MTQLETGCRKTLYNQTTRHSSFDSLFDCDSSTQSQSPSPQRSSPIASSNDNQAPWNIVAPEQGGTPLPPADSFIAGGIQKHPKWEILVCLSCREPHARTPTYCSVLISGLHITTGVYQCIKCGSYFFIEVNGNCGVINKALTMIELLEIFGGHQPSCPLTFSTPAPILDPSTAETAAIDTKPTEKPRSREKWDARVAQQRGAWRNTKKEHLDRVVSSASMGIDDSLPERKPKRKPKRIYETKDDDERVAKRPNLRRRASPITPELGPAVANTTAPSHLPRQPPAADHASPPPTINATQALSQQQPPSGTPAKTMSGLFCTSCGLCNDLYLQERFARRSDVDSSCRACAKELDLHICGVVFF
jgi:hypothetical protein